MSRFSSEHSPSTPADRILHRCDILAAFSAEPGKVTRTFLSPPMHDVHRAVRGWMEEAGLHVRTDALGNIIGSTPSTPADAPVLLLGSHLDTVRDAGRYDGILGVLLAIEASGNAMQAHPLPFRIEVIGFSEEEGVRFRTPYLGSRAVIGQFSPELLDLQDADGVSVAEALTAFGLDPANTGEAVYSSDKLLGFVEVHIEQGPRLEAANRSLGIVDAIAGQSRLRLRLTGRAGHAGTTPMNLRHDALAGAAEIVLALESLGRSTHDLVATAGFLEVHPNVGNVIPGAVELSADIRHKDDPIRETSVSKALRQAQEIASRRGLNFAVTERQDFAAVPMAPELTEALAVAAGKATGTPPLRLTSGAGHDAAILARITPAAMLFLRSPGGISHHPDEAVLREDVEEATQTLTNLILSLAAQSPDVAGMR